MWLSVKQVLWLPRKVDFTRCFTAWCLIGEAASRGFVPRDHFGAGFIFPVRCVNILPGNVRGGSLERISRATTVWYFVVA